VPSGEIELPTKGPSLIGPDHPLDTI
jgi:hypothetical protein